MPPLHTAHIAVRFRPGLSHAARRRAAAECGLAPWQADHGLPGETFSLIPLAGSDVATRSRHADALRRLGDHRCVDRAARVHRHGSTLAVATDRIWLGLSPGRSAAALLTRLERNGARVLAVHDHDHLLRLPAGTDPAVAVRTLSRARGVEYAEPDHVVIGRGHGMKRRGRGVQPALEQIAAPAAWHSDPIGRSVRVAVLDSGVLGSHPDLRGTIVGSFDATGTNRALRPAPWDSHGTECAGLVAATGRAPRGIRGTAPGAGLLAVRIGCSATRLADYVSKPSWIVAGMDWACARGAAVVSMSFGGGPPSTPLRRAIARATGAGRGGLGAVVVAAVGNSGVAPVEFPARAAGVLGVAAVDRHGRVADFSNFGPGVDLAAPGVDITTTTIPDPGMGEPSLYLVDQGTSLATPIVAGVAALVIAANPALRGAAVAQLLIRTARRGPSPRRRVGGGCVDAARAVAAARAAPSR